MLLHCVPVPAHLRRSGWETAAALVELLLRNGDFLRVGGSRGRLLAFGLGVLGVGGFLLLLWVFFFPECFFIL